MWRHAHVAFVNIPASVGFGWESTADGLIQVQWTQGDILPQQLVDVLSSTASAACDSSGIDDVEEDYELDNIIDVIFTDDEDD